MNHRTRIALVLVVVAHCAQAANILCLMGAASQGPRPWSSGLLRSLADRGHRLTVVSADRPDAATTETGNARFVHLESAYDVIRKHRESTETSLLVSGNAFTHMLSWYKFRMTTCKGLLASDGFGEAVALSDGHTFDLVLHDSSHGSWCLLSLAHLFPEAPIVSLSSSRFLPSLLENSPSSPATVPFFTAALDERMGFGQRLYNTALYAASNLFHRFVARPVVRAMVAQNTHVQRAHLPPESEQLLSRVKLVLVNSHPALDHALPLPPHVVAIGGLHLEESRPLPADLAHFIEDENSAGAVLLSLGPNVRLAQLGHERVEAVLRVVRRLPAVRFLWSVDDVELVRDPPENLLVRKWLPQNDLLGHPRLKAFFTHAGWLSVQEAVFHGVPMVMLPLQHDQVNTAHLLAARGVGLRLDLDSFDEATFMSALSAVLKQPVFRERTLELQQAFLLQPQSPLATAVWWVEQLLAHPRSFDLLVPPTDARPGFFVAHSLDVVALVAVFVVLLVLNCYVVVKQALQGFKKAQRKAKVPKVAEKTTGKKSRTKKNQ